MGYALFLATLERRAKKVFFRTEVVFRKENRRFSCYFRVKLNLSGLDFCRVAVNSLIIPKKKSTKSYLSKISY